MLVYCYFFTRKNEEIIINLEKDLGWFAGVLAIWATDWPDSFASFTAEALNSEV